MKLETLQTIIAIIFGFCGLTIPVLGLFIASKVTKVKEDLGKDIAAMEDRLSDRFNRRVEEVEKRMVTREMFEIQTNTLKEKINDIKQDIKRQP